MAPDTTRIPDSTTLRVEEDVLHWRNEDFFISVEEAEQIKSRVEEKLQEVEGVLVDNAEAGGTWPTETDEVWGRLMENIYREGVQCATVAASATNAMHVNRLSKDNDTYDLIRAFKPDERQQAAEFASA
ncbi:MAG: hypothetical protein ABEL97_11580 [Salinibacter sp.]|jgi:hypothetical protein